MDSLYSADDLKFRDDVRQFFRTSVPPDIRRKVALGQNVTAPEMRIWHRILEEKGWAAPGWDPNWGGTGWGPLRLHLFREEMQLAFAPSPLVMNINLVGPLIIAYGNEQQKREFLRPTRNLDYWFAQGFSEPGAGSDLAALRTTAVRDGENYVVNGQKAWTTLAHEANWMFALVRTSSEGKKQDGITYLLIDMATPGITVRPVITLDRDRHVNEVFFDDVRVPITNRVGDENKAWQYAKFLLSNERIGGARTAIPKARIKRAKQIARDIIVDGRPLSEDNRFREKIAAVEVELKALEVTYLRVLAQMQGNPSREADPMSSILKMRGSELMQRTDEVLLELAGSAALAFNKGFLQGDPQEELFGPDWAAALAQKYFLERATTVYAGSSEIQRNILAKSVLRL
jgi:alkylation response protein AidB-like acyl-CoA dehydrogenase